MRVSVFCRPSRISWIMAAGLAAIAVPAVAQDKPVSLYDMMGIKAPGLRGAELDAAVAAAAAHPLGSEKNPVRTTGIAGQKSYLARLRCADGKKPKLLGRGLGPPSPFGGVGDIYGLACGGSESATNRVVMDMYHDHVEDRPIPGFTLARR